MNFNKIIVGAAAVAAVTFGSAANANTTLAECLSTPLVKFDGTVVDAALATPELSTLVDAVVAAGLVDALNDAENITVYAPTNDAFAAIPGDILNAVVADVDILTAVLTYHVSPDRTDPRRYVTTLRRPTLQGQHVFYNRSGQEAQVNNSAVNCQGVSTSNGVVWLIDSVLMPQF